MNGSSRTSLLVLALYLAGFILSTTLFIERKNTYYNAISHITSVKVTAVCRVFERITVSVKYLFMRVYIVEKIPN